jgi:hypothetical protein
MNLLPQLKKKQTGQIVVVAAASPTELVDLSKLNYQCLLSVPPDTTDLEKDVMGWFAAGHEILWIPIYEVRDEPTGIADAIAEKDHFGGPRLIRDVTDFYALPLGIKGWVFPAHLDDTDVICLREAATEISIGHLQHPVTGQRLTWRYDTESEL